MSWAKGLEDVPEGGERCFRCYRLRMEEAAKLAKEGGYDCLHHNLGISPLKKCTERSMRISEELSEIYKVATSDFRFKKEWLQAFSMNCLMSMLCTSNEYCGCVFSKKKPWTENI